MSQIISDNILAISYLIVWIFTLVWYQYIKHTIDSGSIVIVTYIIYAVFSILSLNDALFSAAYFPLKLFPYIYLYVMMMIMLSPIICHHIDSPKAIIDPQTRILIIIGLIIGICAILQIPDIIKDSSTGIVKILTDSDAGKDAYMEQVEEAEDAGSGISNIPAIIYNTLTDIAPFLCFYFMTLQKKKYWLILLLFFSVIIGVIIPITKGQRGGVITGLLTACGAFFFFKPYISKKINKIIQGFGITLICILAIPIAAITMSRFGKESGGVGGFINWYIGQGSLYFNNYGLNAGGTRNGDRTLNLFKRVIDSSTPKNYAERRDKYHNLKLDDYFFSTYVGDFTIDFGPVSAFVIFVIFAGTIIRLTRPRDGTIKLHQMLMIYFTLCISLQGGMTLFSYSDSGNLRIISILLLYAYLRYHEILLQKFPLEDKINN
jgi:oligosaccharide repeat unit polymerase